MSTNYYAVTSEDEPHYKGVFLGKRAGGWVFQFKWHDWSYKKISDNHPYRNYDEFKEFLSDKIIKNEYDEVLDTDSFLEMVEDWCENNNRTPVGSESWKIDGYWFVRGDWC